MIPAFYPEIEQGTPEWLALRLGKPTASNFDTVLAQGRTKGSPSVTRRKYILKLIGERATSQQPTGYKNADMTRGNEMEPEARSAYQVVSGNTPILIGFSEVDLTVNGRTFLVGASPDSLVGEDGLLEIKTAEPHILYEWILAKRLPPEHVAQVQGQLWVTGREWCDFVGYWPGLPVFIHRVYRDSDYHARLKVGLEDFLFDLVQLEAEIAEAT